MPKCLYWLGTMIRTNFLLEHSMDAYLSSSMPNAPRLFTVQNNNFLTAINFLSQRYLFGMMVVATSVAERSWSTIAEDPKHSLDKTTEYILQVLRAIPFRDISQKDVFHACLDLAWQWRRGRSEEHADAECMLDKIFYTLQDRKIGKVNVNDGCSTSFTKEALNDIPAGAIDWLREHRVSLLMFSTWGLVPSIPVSTDSVSQATVPPEDMPLAPAEITPASAGGASSETTPRAAGNAFVERSDWRPLSVEQLPLLLLQHKALLQCLRARPEWAQHRVEIKYRKRSRGQDFYEVECLDGLDCCKRWRAFYIFSAHDMHAGTLILQTCGEHSHETRRATSKLFTSQQLSIAEGFLASGGRDLRGLQLAFSTANIASNTLPNSTQLSNWLKRQKKSQKNTLSRHATLVEVTRLELTALPRSMPDTL
ncbi:unnamed protein product, partial [Durusdinium trenchii]